MTELVREVTPALVGIECELDVLRDGVPVDGRTLADRIGPLGPHLRPGRPSTVRLPSGAEVSAEDGVLELASPPLPVKAGVADELVAWMGTAAAEASGVLASDAHMEGRSTHFSVSLPEEWMTPVCEHVAYRFAPALMLLTEGRDGEGILLRPRFGRLELATEYVCGDRLRASAALIVGGVLASLEVARGRRDARTLPPVVETRVDGATRRFGWYVDRTAFGEDICEHGRATRLKAGGSVTTAEAQLVAAWASARRVLTAFVGEDDLRAADDAVERRAPLPCESAVDRIPEPAPARPRLHVLGAVTAPIVTPALSARVTESDWNTSVLEITQYGEHESAPPARSAPDEALARAARSLERGLPPVARNPVEPAAIEAAVFSGLADPARFVTSARLPATALSTVAAFLYERGWPTRRRAPMARRYRFLGGLLLATGLGVAVGGLLPPRSTERAAASPASDTTVPAAATSSPAVGLTSTTAAPCRITSTVSHVRTDPVDGGWIVLFPVEVRDDDGQVVVGATVAITNAKSDGTSTSAEGQTGPEGIVPFGVRTTQPGVNRIEVIDVESSGCVWDRSTSVNTASGSAP